TALTMVIKTLLVIEESVQMRRLIRVLLANKIERIIECSDGSEALAAYAKSRPDWVLIDINIKFFDYKNAGAGVKPVDAISITQRINQLFPDARITMLADYDDPNIREAAFRAGASGYVVKDDLSSLPGLLGRCLPGDGVGKPSS